ncbi:MAG TPA: ubiquinone/menaquinone biosynthesis methyltransferase [Polyangia bacterium]|jgi:ubiquinone/menaquinone biosynthesis methyltransferase
MTSPVPLPGAPARAPAVRAMFDRIAPTYDLLNRLLAFRTDVRWRRRLVAALALAPGERLLDLCAGTMDVAAAARQAQPAARIVGADFARGMLARGHEKTRIPATQADAAALPFQPASFDACSVAFGVRNLESLDGGLAEIARVLRPGGRLAVLELFRPATWFGRALHAAYSRVALPLVGRAVSGDAGAYRYLVRSIDAFGTREAFMRAVREAGFDEVRGVTLAPGLCGLVSARRARS